MNPTDKMKMIPCIPCSPEEMERTAVSFGALLNMFPCIRAVTDAVGITHTPGRAPLSALSELIANFTQPIITLLSLPNDIIDFIEYGKLPNPILHVEYHGIKDEREKTINSLKELQKALKNYDYSNIILTKNILEGLIQSVIKYLETENKY